LEDGEDADVSREIGRNRAFIYSWTIDDVKSDRSSFMAAVQLKDVVAGDSDAFEFCSRPRIALVNLVVVKGRCLVP
jgi:hypothetical protein